MLPRGLRCLPVGMWVRIARVQRLPLLYYESHVAAVPADNAAAAASVDPAAVATSAQPAAVTTATIIATSAIIARTRLTIAPPPSLLAAANLSSLLAAADRSTPCLP